MTDDQARGNFRFAKIDIPRLSKALGLPETMTFSDRNVSSDVESLCMVLRRLAYPNRLSDLEIVFGRPKSVLSTVINETIDYIYDRFRHLLEDLNQPWLDADHLQSYAEAVHSQGAPYTNCVAFIDGTVRPICLPGISQRLCYNGHKRTHSLKFQSVVIRNGLICNLFGPVEGKRHDCVLLNESDFLRKLRALPRNPTGDMYCVYGDSAYPLRPQLQSPFRGAVITDEQADFNRRKSSVRQCVEWMFGKIVSNFSFLDFKKNWKILFQPVAKYYLVGALLTNCHTSLYGSITSSYFELESPSLEGYLVAR